jgi:hypothetical protein
MNRIFVGIAVALTFACTALVYSLHSQIVLACPPPCPWWMVCC